MSQYKTGTVTVTQGNASIVGTGTSWLANVTAGSIFSLIGSGVPYVVGTVVDDTHITLASNYAAANASNVSYAATTSYTPNLSIPYPEQGDVDTATIMKRAAIVIDNAVTGPAPTINATSTSNVAIGTGNKTFITQTGKQFAAPQFLIAANAANSSQYLAGQVVSYNTNDGTLVLGSTTTNGSSNVANWAISLSGVAGATGTAATISVGNTTTGAPGSNAGVTNSGNSSAAVFNFNVPAGAAATISVGTTTTGAAGSNASVANSGNSSAAVFNFTVPAGANGTNGANGVYGGALTLNHAFSTTTTNADPGSGIFRLNNATQNGATAIYISKTDTNSVDVSASIAEFDASNNANKGYVRLVEKNDATKFVSFKVTGRTDHTGYSEIAVTNISSSANSPFANTDSLLIAFSRTGDKGTDGAGTGTVTSVGLSMPALFSVANSPITGSGTFGVTLATQNANLIFAGPSSGNAAAPTFRQLAAADQGTMFNANGSTIAIGGAVTFSGAFTTTINVTANSNVTVPMSGTLATLAGNESFSNKTVNNYTFTAPANNATLTIGNGKTFTVNNTVTFSGTDSTSFTLPGASDTLAGLGTAETFTKAQRGAYVTLTDAATIALDLSLGNNYLVVLGGNRTLGAPTNAVAGQTGQISARQDPTGSRTLAYAWTYMWTGGTAGTLSTAGCTLDQLIYDVEVWSSSTVTITIAAPGVVTWTSHGLNTGQRVQLTSTGNLPTGLTANTTYFWTTVDANSGKLSTTLANAAAATFITTTGSQSGAHTMTAATIKLALNKAYA